MPYAPLYTRGCFVVAGPLVGGNARLVPRAEPSLATRLVQPCAAAHLPAAAAHAVGAADATARRAAADQGARGADPDVVAALPRCGAVAKLKSAAGCIAAFECNRPKFDRVHWVRTALITF